MTLETIVNHEKLLRQCGTNSIGPSGLPILVSCQVFLTTVVTSRTLNHFMGLSLSGADMPCISIGLLSMFLYSDLMPIHSLRRET